MDKGVTIAELCQVTGYKRSCLMRIIAENPGFPKPWNLTGTPRGRRWNLGEVREFLGMMREAA